MTVLNGRRIVKNTALLYFRMLLVMGVGFFTTRIVLRILGAADYGIYNIAAGVVAMISFISSAETSTTQRFLTFELGKGNDEQLRKVFSVATVVHVAIALLLILVAETLGLWFVNKHLVIPPDRLVAANWAYQSAVAIVTLSVLRSPYEATIIAHERMGVYAHVGVLEAMLKLGTAYALSFFGIDKLKIYAVMMALIVAAASFVFFVYCRKHFEESRGAFRWEKELFRSILGFSGWNLFGAFAYVSQQQGTNILLNLFFGPVVNAARAIAMQVFSAINSFVYNFYMAVRPQVVKSFSSGDIAGMLKLVFSSSRYCYYMMLTLSMPVLLATEYVLTLWLKAPPEHTLSFTRLVIVNALIDTLSIPLVTTAQATGRIKVYQAVVGGMLILNLPISFFFLKMGAPPETVYCVSIVLSLICLGLRVLMLKRMVSLPVEAFFKKVLFVIGYVTFLSFLIPGIARHFLSMRSFFDLAVIILLSLVSCTTVVYFTGMNAEERDLVWGLVETKLLKRVRSSSGGA